MNAVTEVNPQEVMQPVDHMVSMIERVAMDPEVPIERLEKMMDLKDRHDEGVRRDRAEKARQVFNSAMAKAQKAMPSVKKTKRNDHTRSTYADLADIERQAMPVAYDHGFSVSFTPAGADEKGNLLIDWCLMHEDGHTKTGQAGFPLDVAGSQGKTNKTGIQAMGSTMTYGRRYLLCNLFNIATGDDVDGNAQPEVKTPITADQFLDLRDLIEQAGITDEVVCTAEGLAELHELPSAKFNMVKNKMKTTIENKRKATEATS